MKKKIVAMMLASVMACGLWACGGSGDPMIINPQQNKNRKKRKKKKPPINLY